jgi:hypothetical protein
MTTPMKETDMANNDRKLPPKEWGQYFQKAQIRTEELDKAKNNRGKGVVIGRFFSPNVGREVPIEVKGRTGKAVLHVENGRAKEKRYFFVVTWDDEAATATSKTDDHQPTKKSEKKTKKFAGNMKPAPTKRASGGVKPKPASKSKPASKKKPVRSTTGGNNEDW